MKTVIVTGGAGFIGSSFVRAALAGTPWRVVVFDKLTYAGNTLNLAEVEGHPRYHFVRGDIAERGAVNALFTHWQPDAVVNFAAETHVDRSIDGPRNFLEANVTGTFELLEASRRLWTQLGANNRRAGFRLLQISTDEVYGSLDATGRFTETTAYAPNSPYAASKAAADHFVQAYFATYGLPVLRTNCSNNYGPRQFPEKLIPLMIHNALAGKPLPIYGDGRNVRDWLHVEDHCAALLTVLQHGTPGASYNIGGNSERTNLEVLDEVCGALDRLLPIAANPAVAQRGLERYAELRTFVPDRPGHDRRYAIDCARLERELGWTPRINFADGIRETVRWFLHNRQWSVAVQNGRYAGERLGLALGVNQ